MKIHEYFKLALINFAHRKLRSFLTVLGIIIGVTAVVGLISLGKGMQQGVEDVFESVGKNTIIVMSGAGISFISSIASSSSQTALTEKDMRVIKGIKGIEKAVPVIYLPDMIKYRKNRIGVYIAGVPPEDVDVFYNKQGYDILIGRKLKPGDKYVAVIGYDIYDKYDISVGDKIKIGDKGFRVVGVVEKIGSRLDDNTISIPLSTFRSIYHTKERLSYIYIIVKENEDIDEVAERVRETLRRKRGEKKGEESFQVLSSKQLLNAVSNVLSILNVVVVGIASVSIIVGGVGIMNTMYTAILERTREIGIFKAIGMKRRDILLIFVIEAGLLGMFGGLVGVGLGLSFSEIAVYIAKTQAGITYIKAYTGLDLILGSLLFSFILGALSGLIPARQASNLNVVDAIRWE